MSRLQGDFSRRLKCGVSSVAMALAVFTAAGAAHADDQGSGQGAGEGAGQQTPPPAQGPAAKPAGQANQVSEVVVTGFRNSLAKAINIKRDADSEVDTILAEDIGKFPDLNLAESLQRIPGVAISREGGEGREITVRGLGPQYTRVLINGMEALTTVGSPDSDGGVNRTRAFDFNVFSSDLFNQLTLRKTAEGNLEEGALGATVEMSTAHPLDYNGFRFIAQAKGDYNTLASETGPRASMLMSDTWDDGHFGALVSLSYGERKYDDAGASTVRWDEGNVLNTGTSGTHTLVGFGSVLGTNCQVFPLPTVCATADAALHPRFPRYDFYQDDEKRTGATASFQWKPDDNNLFSLDYLHSYWWATRQEQYLEAPGFSGTGKCTNVNTCTSIANISVLSENIVNGVMEGGTFNGVDTRVEDRYDVMHTEFDQITLHGQTKFNDQWSMDELVGASISNFDNPIQTTLGYDQFNVQGFQYNFANSRVPLLNFGSANLTSSGPWVLTEVRERPQSTDNDFDTAQWNLHWRPSDNFALSAGLSYKEYTFQATSLRLVNGETVTSTNAYKSLLSIPISSYDQVINFANATGANVPGGSTPTTITPDVFKAASLFGLYTSSLFALSTTGDLGDNATEKEHDYGAYAQADFKFDLLGHPLSGNFGMRDVRTDQFSQGFSFVANVLRADDSSRSYNNFLPSMNLAWQTSDDTIVRFAAARVMARPNLTDLLASTSVTVSGSNFTVKTGNPALNPFLANSYDLDWEWYPSRGTMLSVAVFHKDILSLVTTKVQNLVFHGNPFGIPDSAAIAACGSAPGCSPSAVWQFSVPVNTPGGGVNGLEINYQQQFTMLPGFLSHTGALLNLTYVDSSVLYPTATAGKFVSDDLLGLSRYSANATLYYEDPKWSVRVSGAFRSKYLSAVPGKEVGTNADGFDASFNLDASIQYTVNDHLKMTLEAVNLTDQYENQFDDTGHDLPMYYHHTGSDILFGIRWQY
jgi:iron complex outermembrane receptor protein